MHQNELFFRGSIPGPTKAYSTPQAPEIIGREAFCPALRTPLAKNCHAYKCKIDFTARRYASAVYATALCPSVSVTSRCSTKTDKLKIIHTTPLDSAETLVF